MVKAIQQFWAKKIGKLSVLAVPLVLFLSLSLFLHLSHQSYLQLPPCLYLSAFDHPCAGCGGTRAVSSLARLDILAAIQYNAFVFLLAIYLIPVYVLTIYRVVRQNQWIRIQKSHLFIIALAIPLWWILRNLPFYPFPIE